jgi:hypothetical protein
VSDIQKKILLVHLYSNGDCLYATAVAKQIKQDFPGCHLTWAIANFCKNIISNNPYVDAVMEIDIAKDDVARFRKLRKEFNLLKQQGRFDEIFITHLMDTNLAYYDGSIRSAILKAYKKPITVDITPVLKLTETEINKAAAFTEEHQLGNYKHVILFEFAPQSKQLHITIDLAISIAEKLAANKEVAIILSSANKIAHPYANIIDGSPLSFRETAAITHYCTFLLGCSSGITWITTSDAAKPLPMVQLIDPHGAWLNPVSRDFKRFGLDVTSLIELTQINQSEIVECTQTALENFETARNKYNRHIPINFKTTRKIVYNLLCYFEFAAIAKHIRVNREVYGNNFSFYTEVFLGIITAPFKLAKNLFFKRKLKKRIA